MVSCSVHHVRRLCPGTFVIRFERQGLAFEPGQHLFLGLAGAAARREYSISSGMDDEFLEALVREIPGGIVSGAIARCLPGDALAVEGPYGLFTTRASERRSGRYLFVSTGTGIAPFRSMARSYPGMDYQVLHGIRRAAERSMDGTFDASRYAACVSREEGGDFDGRVTDRLRSLRLDTGSLCYLCGNGAMIDEAFSILRAQGVPRDRIFAEVYY
jgi:ferredoxin--NADP+ reductase